MLYLGLISNAISFPSRLTTTRAGVAATQLFTCAPAHRWVPIWFRIAFSEPPTPSTETTWSPGRRTAADADPFSIVATFVFATDWPCDRAMAQKIKNAISRFTAGPARITTIRFHTFWL